MPSNPFRYGGVATGRYFTDRVGELADVCDDVANGQNIVIISPRRYGKTSLMYEAMDRLRKEQTLVAYLDLFRTPTKDRFADLLAAAIYHGLINPVERAGRLALDLFHRLPIQPKVTIGTDGTPSFEFSAGPRSRDVDQTIEGLLGLPGKIAEERQRRVAIIFDEFQQVLEIDEHLPGLMRAVFQTQGEVAHVFMGSKRHLMNDVFTNRNQPLYKMAKPVVLHPIKRDDFDVFIRARFRETGQGIGDDAVNAILDITEGHPHDTQELCYFTWAVARGAGRTVVQVSEVSDALEQVLDAESAHFITLWEDLSVHQRIVLGALSVESGQVYSEDYRRRHRAGAAASVQRSIMRLIEREIIEQSAGNGYHIADVFFRVWIERRVR